MTKDEVLELFAVARRYEEAVKASDACFEERVCQSDICVHADECNAALEAFCRQVGISFDADPLDMAGVLVRIARALDL